MGPTRSGRGQAKQATDVATKNEEVIALPAKARAEELPFGGDQRGDHEQAHGAHAAKFYYEFFPTLRGWLLPLLHQHP
jgi:hypothetical protein